MVPVMIDARELLKSAFSAVNGGRFFIFLFSPVLLLLVGTWWFLHGDCYMVIFAWWLSHGGSRWSLSPSLSSFQGPPPK